VIVDFGEGVEREYPAGDVERPMVRGCAVLAGGKCTGGCSERKPAAEPEPDE
jgi:hypothetical protein